MIILLYLVCRNGFAVGISRLHFPSEFSHVWILIQVNSVTASKVCGQFTSYLPFLSPSYNSSTMWSYWVARSNLLLSISWPYIRCFINFLISFKNTLYRRFTPPCFQRTSAPIPFSDAVGFWGEQNKQIIEKNMQLLNLTTQCAWKIIAVSATTVHHSRFCRVYIMNMKMEHEIYVIISWQVANYYGI